MRLELQEKKLDQLAQAIKQIDDELLKSHLSKYFCILVSGFIENSIKQFVSDYHHKTCKIETSKFVSTKMRNLTNLDDQKICDFLNLFSDDWVETYRENRTDEMESAFNSIYAQRNKIAHGDSYNSNITYNNITTYYTAIKDAMALLSLIIAK
jgi:hypothetical protein